jgi:hypothetical protein
LNNLQVPKPQGPRSLIADAHEKQIKFGVRAAVQSAHLCREAALSSRNPDARLVVGGEDHYLILPTLLCNPV